MYLFLELGLQSRKSSRAESDPYFDKLPTFFFLLPLSRPSTLFNEASLRFVTTVIWVLSVDTWVGELALAVGISLVRAELRSLS